MGSVPDGRYVKGDGIGSEHGLAGPGRCREGKPLSFPGRIVNSHFKPQSQKALRNPPPDGAAPNHGEAGPLGQGVGEHGLRRGHHDPIGHGVSVTARRMGKRNASARQESLIHMIHPRGARAHEAGLGVPQESRIDARLAAEEKDVRRPSLCRGSRRVRRRA